MLILKIGNTFISTRDVDIPVVLRSPLFTEDGRSPGSFLFDFTVPFTDELKHELSFAHRASRKGKPQYKHPFLLIFGILRYCGTANITELSDDEVSINMPVDSGDLSTLLGDKKLSDLPISDNVLFNPQITFADCAKPYTYFHQQQGLFVHDIWIKPSIKRIDTFNSFSLPNHHWVCPQTKTYRINVIINWAFDLVTFLGQTYPAGSAPVFRLYKNGVVLATASIETDSYFYSGSIALVQGDILTVSLRAVSVMPYGLHILSARIDSGSSISVFVEEPHFIDAATIPYPDSPYCIYPYFNPNALDNVPDSLFSIDFGDIKDNIAKYSPTVNYYLLGSFPLVISGYRDNRYFALLNLFSPSVYVAFIVRKILEMINFSSTQNIFETPSFSRICLLTNKIINNYSYDGQPHHLIDFLPDMTIKDFLSSLCSSLGITLSVNSNARNVSFFLISEIINDNSSINFDDNIIGESSLYAVTYDSYSLSLTKPRCNHISSFSKPFDGLNILPSVQSYFYLPADAQINDCRYVTSQKNWFYFNYDEDSGTWNWIFLTIDFPFKVTSDPDPSFVSSFDIMLPFSSTLNNRYHPVLGAGDKTIGAPSFRNWTIPAFEAACNYKQLPGAFKSNDSFCIHLFHGPSNDNQYALYPLASNDVFAYYGALIPGAGQSLRLDTPLGLYAQRFKPFIDLLISSPGDYRLYKMFSLLEIASLNWLRWHEIRGVKYLLKEIKFNIKHDHLTPAEIIAIRK